MKEELREVYERSGISEAHLGIKNVQVRRGQNEMQIFCERKKGLVEDERLLQWESLLRELLPEWRVSMTLASMR